MVGRVSYMDLLFAFASDPNGHNLFDYFEMDTLEEGRATKAMSAM